MDIRKVVFPTIVEPWRERIAAAKTRKALLELRQELIGFKVLDPACGSGNFLYVAYRELRRLELAILLRLRAEFKSVDTTELGCAVGVRQLFGFDVLPFAVEVAKVTMMLAKELSIIEMHEALEVDQLELTSLVDPALPLDNLDDRIVCADALHEPWPRVDAIIGNPPFQSKNKMQAEFGAAYMAKLRKAYPGVPGRADYCVYFLRRAHDHLLPGQRAGMVGTNTIRQNYSREGGLDHVVANGGTITNAISTQDWSGEAAVHVSIVNWIRAPAAGPFVLGWQTQGGEWLAADVDAIPSSLSASADATRARELLANQDPKTCFQGQTHGHDGFVLETAVAEVIRSDVRAVGAVHPYLIADVMFGDRTGAPDRYVIDLNSADNVFEAMKFGRAFTHVEKHVRPDIVAKAEAEARSTGKATGPRQKHAERWWRHWRGRGEMMSAIAALPRYVACGQVTKRPIFAFVDPSIHPNAALMVFAFDDDYSFGVLQSAHHWSWFTARCSTLEERPRYTSNTVWDSFPWPQTPSLEQVRAVADAAVAVRRVRADLQSEHSWSLRDLYRASEVPGRNPLRDAHDRLDGAVAAAYGMPKGADLLPFLLSLNAALADREASGGRITGPGLPSSVPDRGAFVTADAIRMPAT